MPNINQQPNMTPDQAAAALSFATMLSEGLMPKQTPMAKEQPQEAPPTPGSEETLDLGEDTTKQENETKMAEIETKMKDMEEMIERMKKEIQDMNKKEPEEPEETKETKDAGTA